MGREFQDGKTMKTKKQKAEFSYIQKNQQNLSLFFLVLIPNISSLLIPSFTFSLIKLYPPEPFLTLISTVPLPVAEMVTIC